MLRHLSLIPEGNVKNYVAQARRVGWRWKFTHNRIIPRFSTNQGAGSGAA